MNRDPVFVLCLAGPTASGKTDLAIRLAHKFNCEIVNADSRQVYADFPLICAQPSSEEQLLCPHHLYGFLPTEARISAGAWIEKAMEVITDIVHRGKIPLLCGGTGMYFQALLHGIAPIPAVDTAIREEVERRADSEGLEILYAELLKQDPLYAKSIHPHDRQRIVRALEVLIQTGQTFSWWHTKTAKPCCVGPLFVLKRDIAWLEPRIHRRIEQMLASGAVEEAMAAKLKCDDGTAPGWTGIGCMELFAYLAGRISLEIAQSLWQQNTRAYAKRQNTWFRGRKEAIFVLEEADLWSLVEKSVGQYFDEEKHNQLYGS